MKGEKYHIYLSTKERNEIVAFLINQNIVFDYLFISSHKPV